METFVFTWSLRYRRQSRYFLHYYSIRNKA